MKKSRIISSVLAVIVAASSVFALASCNKDEKETATTTAPVATHKAEEGVTDVEFVPNVTAPSAPAETVEEDHSRINEYATEPNGDGSFTTEIGAVKFVYPEYFAWGNSYVAIKAIEVDDTGFTHNADAWVDFEVLARGENEDAVKISYIGYDDEGNITRRSQITVNLFGFNVGDIVEDCRMDFKRETVKIVFTEFKEITE